jgi:anti-sigma factor RsiW
MTARTRGIIAALLGPKDHEIGCDECFDVLDAYVDREAAGLDAEAATPGMRAHLAGCPACREDHESLRALVTADQRA